MSIMTKETFLKQKISNFLIFIKEKIGDDNNVYRNFVAYSQDLNSFLQAFIQLKQVGGISSELIAKYLEIKGIKTKIEK